jgi:hypothetical protein
MPTRKYIPFFALLIALSFSGTVHASARFVSGNDSVNVDSPTSQDGFFAGDAVSITGPVTGEAFVAGNTVSISQPIGRSAVVAGNTINITKGAGYNLFAAGNSISLDGEFGNDVYVAGSSVTIAPTAVIKGDLYIAGSTVTLAGVVNGNVHINSANVISSVKVGGSLTGVADSLQFNGGSISKDFTYTSKNSAIDINKVAIGGTTTRQQPPTAKRQTAAATLARILTMLLSTLFFAAVLIALVPGLALNTLTGMANNWLTNLGIGAIVLFLTPILAGLAFAVVIGWKIALVLLLLYVAALLTAGVMSTLYVGSFLVQRFSLPRGDSIWVQLVVGAVILAILQSIKFIGPLAGILVFLGVFIPALGALTTSVVSSLRSQPRK